MTVPALAAALLWRWTEAWAVGVIGAVLIVLAIPFLFGAHAYRVRIELPTTRVVAGDALPVTVAVHNAATRPAMPLVAELPVGEEVFEVAVPFLAPDQSFAQDPEIDAQRRGVLTVGPLTIARRDPVGLFRKEVTWPETHRVYVHPKTVRLPAHTTGLLRDLEGAPLGKLTDSDLAFHAIREYQPGDERRHIHWNSTAKTGAFMVRQFEESQSARVAVLFDPHESAYATAGEFELGVSIAASVGLQAVIDRRERYVYADRELPSRNGEGLLDSFAALRAVSAAGSFEATVRALARSRADLSMVMLVTGSETSLHTLQRCAALLPPNTVTVGVRAELHGDPKIMRQDRTAFLTVGALEDLPQLLIRGAL